MISLFSANSNIGVKSAGKPYKSTGIIALVCLLITFSIDSNVIVYVSSSISAKTGFAPVRSIASAVAEKVKEGRITSSRGPMFAARRAACKADVPLDTAIACLIPIYSANLCSNSITRGPIPLLSVNIPLLSTSTTEFISSSSRETSFIRIISLTISSFLLI